MTVILVHFPCVLVNEHGLAFARQTPLLSYIPSHMPVILEHVYVNKHTHKLSEEGKVYINQEPLSLEPTYFVSVPS